MITWTQISFAKTQMCRECSHHYADSGWEDEASVSGAAAGMVMFGSSLQESIMSMWSSRWNKSFVRSLMECEMSCSNNNQAYSSIIFIVWDGEESLTLSLSLSLTHAHTCACPHTHTHTHTLTHTNKTTLSTYSTMFFEKLLKALQK